ncbi:MAG: hypothetical protein D6741_17145, partial [Planctomycetota bacterium]
MSSNTNGASNQTKPRIPINTAVLCRNRRRVAIYISHVGVVPPSREKALFRLTHAGALSVFEGVNRAESAESTAGVA